MKFLLLNAEVYFNDILQEAKAVILAGGTLEPVTLHVILNAYLYFIIQKSEIINQLLEKVPPQKIRSFSCGHIIPKDNLLLVTLKR
jgi:chromosome transmission fidelity protein 1